VDIGNVQPHEQVNILKRLQPDAYIGVPIWAAKLGIATSNLLDAKRPTMGYEGLLYLGDKIASQIENPGLNRKIARYATLNYKDSWYDADPFKFIRTEQVAPGTNR
jgi:nitrogenase molybdenum-iron protein alpha chain